MAERNLHEEIDDLSRELTEEIEAHRVTRAEVETRVKEWKARAEAAEARVKELEAWLVREEDNSQKAHDAADLADVLRSKAEASKAALIREVEAWLLKRADFGAYVCNCHACEQLRAILDKHRGQP